MARSTARSGRRRQLGRSGRDCRSPHQRSPDAAASAPNRQRRRCCARRGRSPACGCRAAAHRCRRSRRRRCRRCARRCCRQRRQDCPRPSGPSADQAGKAPAPRRRRHRPRRLRRRRPRPTARRRSESAPRCARSPARVATDEMVGGDVDSCDSDRARSRFARSRVAHGSLASHVLSPLAHSMLVDEQVAPRAGDASARRCEVEALVESLRPASPEPTRSQAVRKMAVRSSALIPWRPGSSVDQRPQLGVVELGGVGVASRLCAPSSLMISLARGNHRGNVGRIARNGRSSQNHTPLPHSWAPASAA